MKLELKIGDCVEVLPSYPADHFDSCVTDPPYMIGFMGKEWDSSRATDRRAGNIDNSTLGFSKTGIPNSVHAAEFASQNRLAYDWHSLWAREVFRVLKPGAWILAFGGTRTYHRLTCALEDVGFEVRDCIFWIYGSGFPKSLDVSKAIDRELGNPREVAGRGPTVNRTALDYGGATGKAKNGLKAAWSETDPNTPEAAKWSGWGTALKPACEPIVVARKPLIGTVAENVLKHGTGGMNVDATRVAVTAEDAEDMARANTPGSGRNVVHEQADGKIGRLYPNGPMDTTKGRWPANVILTHHPDCQLVGMKRVRGAGHYPSNTGESPMFGGDQGGLHGIDQEERFIKEEVVENWSCVPGCPVRILDAQSGELQAAGNVNPSNIGDGTLFGIGDMGPRNPRIPGDVGGGASRFFYVAKASREERERGLGPPMECVLCAAEREHDEHIYNGHPTVKPVDLIRYLARLVTQPGGLLLDPFAGSGTTLIAAKFEGFNVLGIEKQPEYETIIRRRLKAWAPLEGFGDEATP